MKKLKLSIIAFSLLSTTNFTYAASNTDSIINNSFWQNGASSFEQNNINSKAEKSLYFDIDIDLLNQQLINHNSIQVSLPVPDGSFVTFLLTPSRVMHPELSAKYPNIKTFSGYQIGNKNNRGQFDISNQGFHGLFNVGDKQVFIDPLSRDNNRQHHNYYRSDAQPIELDKLTLRLAPRKQTSVDTTSIVSTTVNQKSDQLTTYRLAIATTGEYANFHGGTKESTLAALATLVSRLNDVYQRDLSVKFELVAANDSIIFTDSASDPYANTDDDIDLNARVIDDAIGAENYDIGHLVGTGGGGLAGFQVACSSRKAEGVTGSSNPTADAFYIDYVAHEIGHQFGADHTFNGAQSACNGNREPSSAYEPGSASTIMGYAGICGSQNLQNNSDPYFHIHSIDQINTYIATVPSNCGMKASNTNTAPTVDAGQDYTIPAKTPFILTGSAIDAENDSLSYSWEQHDLGPQSSNRDEDALDDGSKPLFRAFSPKSSAERTFPKIDDILANTASYGESLPTTTRELNFRLVVRDNQNNLADDAMKISVINAPQGFSINEITGWHGANQTITWHTANSENAPISCLNVDIFLSTDSGQTFTQTLANQVENNGSYDLTLNNITSTTARIKVACSDNIFFAINNADFEISPNELVPSKPVFVRQSEIKTDEDTKVTLDASMFTFENNQSVDSLAVLPGNNYTVSALDILPKADFNGSIMVNMTATTNNLLSDTFQVKVDVTPINDEPVALDDEATFEQDSSANSIDVLANDTDIDDETLTITAASTNSSGTIEISENKLSYTPASGFHGTETISYTIEDSAKASANAKLQITVTATPVAPTPPPAPTPTPTPAPVEEKSKSSGGSFYYLLLLGLACARFKLKKGLIHA